MLTPSELGIKEVNWKFEFCPYGASVHSSPGTVFVDVGNRLDLGIIDHHFKDSAYKSSTSAIAANSHLVLHHLLGPINETYYRGAAIERKTLTFVFATHQFPDWDGLTAFYLCDCLVRNGRLPPASVTRAICEATDVIDQGHARIGSDTMRPFLVYLMMMHGSDPWSQWLQRGLELLNTIISNANPLTKDDFLKPFSSANPLPTQFAEEEKLLRIDKAKFDNDLKHIDRFNIFVPTRDEVARKAEVIAFRNPVKSALYKYYVREESPDCISVVPFDRSCNGIADRFVISVAPYSKFVLPVLGYRLESAETTERERQGVPRGGNPRYEKEYSDNSDPWYDGRGHEYTIIDSPNCGTVLSYKTIIGILKATFKRARVGFEKTSVFDGFISYRRDGGSDSAWALCSELTNNGNHVFLDVKSLGQGYFDSHLLESIRNARHFILLLTPGALDRCRDSEDWVRKEIQEALQCEKNIIPVCKEGFIFPQDSELPEELRGLFRYNAITWSHEYFYETVGRIVRFMK